MIEGIPILGLTAPGVLLLVVILFLLGKIVPRSALEDKIAEAGRWQKAYEAERQARITADEHSSELLELARTTRDLIQATFNNSDKIRRSGEADVSSKQSKA